MLGAASLAAPLAAASGCGAPAVWGAVFAFLAPSPSTNGPVGTSGWRSGFLAMVAARAAAPLVGGFLSSTSSSFSSPSSSPPSSSALAAG